MQVSADLILGLPAAAVSSSDGEIQQEEADEEQSSWGLGDVDWTSPQSEEWYQECLDFECFRDRYTKQACIDCVTLWSTCVVAEAIVRSQCSIIKVKPALFALHDEKSTNGATVLSDQSTQCVPSQLFQHTMHTT